MVSIREVIRLKRICFRIKKVIEAILFIFIFYQYIYSIFKMTVSYVNQLKSEFTTHIN